jgi:hypothetical protein
VNPDCGEFQCRIVRGFNVKPPLAIAHRLVDAHPLDWEMAGAGVENAGFELEVEVDAIYGTWIAGAAEDPWMILADGPKGGSADGEEERERGCGVEEDGGKTPHKLMIAKRPSRASRTVLRAVGKMIRS